jgi:hypothetical protein
MKNILKIILPAVAVALVFSISAHAQTDGYRFGVGLGYSGYDGPCSKGPYNRNFLGLAIAPTPRVDAPPFFAQYPPVYYSQDIIARPYGVSPYAAPAGITPVEMGGSHPLHQVNPYYVDPGIPLPSDTVPPAEPKEGSQDTSPKTTWIQNPYYQSITSPAGDEVALK